MRRSTGSRRVAGQVGVATYRLGSRVRAKLFSLLVGGAFHAFGVRSVLQPPIRLVGEEAIAIGDDVWIGPGSWLQTLGEPTAQPKIVLGDGTSVAGSCVISAAASIRVGRKVLFARNVYIADHMHAFEDVQRAVLEQGITRIRPVEIGDGAWLGQNVVVGPGVRIGRGAVIGANSVVLSDVPDFAIAVGAPARIVREFGSYVRSAT